MGSQSLKSALQALSKLSVGPGSLVLTQNQWGERFLVPSGEHHPCPNLLCTLCLYDPPRFASGKEQGRRGPTLPGGALRVSRYSPKIPSPLSTKALF